MLLDCCALWMLETRMTLYLRWHSLLFTLGTPAAAFMIKKQHLSCQPPSSFSKRLMRHCHYICYHLSPSDYLMEDFGMQGYGMLCWWHHYILLGLLRDLQWRKGEPWSKKVCWPGVWRPGSLWVGPAGKWAGTTKRNCKQIQTHSKQIWLNQKCMDIGINHMTDSHSIYQQINMLRVRMTWNTTCWLKLKYSTILMGQNYITNRRPNYGRVLWW